MPLDSRSIALPYADGFAAVADVLPGPRDRRERAIERFRQLGLPTVRVERWKYTNLNSLVAASLIPARGERIDAASVAQLLPPALAPRRLVFVNGRLQPELSNAAASLAGDPPARELTDDALLALNTALATDGCILRVAEPLADAIEIVHVGMPGLGCHYRHAIELAAGASATVIETFVGDGTAAYWTNPVSDIRIGDAANLRHYKLQDEGQRAFHLAATDIQVGRDGTYENFVLATGAGLARNEIKVVLDGPGASCRLDGAYLGSGRQHLDTTTEIIHARPNTTSSETYKGVLDDQARGVFQGRIVVAKDAQKADGHQLNKTILLSERAEIDSKPELEIFADDVKCSHGAAAGELDEDALFYLRARGIDVTEARRLLIAAFIADVIEGIGDNTVRQTFGQRVAAWMQAPHGAHAA